MIFQPRGCIRSRREIHLDQLSPAYSPDGTKIACLKNRETLDILTVADGSVKTVAPQGHFYSYHDGDIRFSWSLDVLICNHPVAVSEGRDAQLEGAIASLLKNL